MFLRLFSSVIVRHVRREWGQLLLATVGVTIGVAVFVAIRLANTTAFDAFAASVDAVAGRANLQIVAVGGDGLDQRLVTTVRETRAVSAAAPAIERYALIVDPRPLDRSDSAAPILLLGIDPLAEGPFRRYDVQSAAPEAPGLDFLVRRDAIAITTALASAHGLAVGDSVTLVAAGVRLRFVVSGLVVPEGTAAALAGRFALLDIATAQAAFGDADRVDRIDLIVPEREVDEIAGYLGTILPAGAAVRTPESRSTQTLRMLDAFDLNLSALAFIALFVSMFIIYNTLLTTTLRRRRELGILRAVGAERGVIVSLFLAQALAIGALGAAAGLPVGIALARGALDEVMETVSALYVLSAASEIRLDTATLVIGGLLGVVASVLSALPAAIEASRVQPRETFSVQYLESRLGARRRTLALASMLVLAGAVLASLQGLAAMSPALGFAGAALVLLGFALVVPAFLSLAHRLFGRAVRRVLGVEGELAAAYLVQSIGRSSTAVAALMSAIAMLVGVSTMIGSFRSTVDLWMNQTIAADLYLTIASNRLTPGALDPIPSDVLAFVDSLPQAAYVDAVRRLRLPYRGREITVSGARLTLPPGDRSLTFMDGEWAEVLRAMDTGAVAVSESFSRRFDRWSGDTIVLGTPTGPQTLTVAGVYYDYTTDAGSVMLRTGPFARLFRDTTLTNVALYLRDPGDAGAVRAAIEGRFGSSYALLVYSNRALREEVLAIFDQTFAITYALQIVAIIVAAIGVAKTLAAMVVERSREIGIMRAVGATAGQVRRMTLVQAGLIGLASQILGVVAGVVLSAILIYVINRVSFGWTIQFELSPALVLGSSLLVLATALVAGIVPAAAAARRPIADAVRTE